MVADRLDGFGKLSGAGGGMCAGAPGGWELKHTSTVKRIPNNIGARFLRFDCLFNTETEGYDVTSCSASVNQSGAVKVEQQTLSSYCSV